MAELAWALALLDDRLGRRAAWAYVTLGTKAAHVASSFGAMRVAAASEAILCLQHAVHGSSTGASTEQVGTAVASLAEGDTVVVRFPQ